MDEPISKSAVDALPRHDWDWDGMGEMPDGGYFAVADVVALHDALAAENERLREAVQKIAEAENPYEPCGWAINTARAALSNTVKE